MSLKVMVQISTISIIAANGLPYIYLFRDNNSARPVPDTIMPRRLKNSPKSTGTQH
jgi:hypothetical protein